MVNRFHQLYLFSFDCIFTTLGFVFSSSRELKFQISSGTEIDKGNMSFNKKFSGNVALSHIMSFDFSVS